MVASLDHKSIEDEEHFLCECPLYSNLRGIYLNAFYLTKLDPDVITEKCSFCAGPMGAAIAT
jgi:hypothetical protein